MKKVNRFIIINKSARVILETQIFSTLSEAKKIKKAFDYDNDKIYRLVEVK